MPENLSTLLGRLLGSRVVITTDSGTTFVGSLSAVSDDVVILAVGTNTCYLRRSAINSVCTTTTTA